MSSTNSARRWHFADFNEIEGVPCPCGIARRAFSDVADFPGSLHITEISADAKKHYHRRLTETYVILECGEDAAMELDDEIIPVRPRQSIVIPPGVRHRAIGKMTVLIVCVPSFDANDEWLDDDSAA